MNFLDFLNYLHHGAFSSAKKFFDLLERADIKNLRLTCRTIERVASSYRVFSTIYLSPKKADLDAFKGICANSELVQHVREIVYDHSVYNMHLLEDDPRNPPLYYPQGYMEEDKTLVWVPKFWLDTAGKQKEILAKDLDIEALTDALTRLTNLPKVQTHGIDFPNTETSIRFVSGPESVEGHPPSTSVILEILITLFCLSLRNSNVTSTSGLAKALAQLQRIGAPHRLLSSSEVDWDSGFGLPSTLFAAHSAELELIQRAFASVTHTLELVITSEERSPDLRLLTNALSFARNLEILELTFDRHVQHPLLIFMAIPLEDIAQLRCLSFAAEEATLNELLEFSLWCGRTGIRRLRLKRLHLTQGLWKDAIKALKDDGNLTHLDDFEIFGVTDDESSSKALRSRTVFYNTEPGILPKYLRGEGELNPVLV